MTTSNVAKLDSRMPIYHRQAYPEKLSNNFIIPPQEVKPSDYNSLSITRKPESSAIPINNAGNKKLSGLKKPNTVYNRSSSSPAALQVKGEIIPPGKGRLNLLPGVTSKPSASTSAPHNSQLKTPPDQVPHRVAKTITNSSQNIPSSQIPSTALKRNPQSLPSKLSRLSVPVMVSKSPITQKLPTTKRANPRTIIPVKPPPNEPTSQFNSKSKLKLSQPTTAVSRMGEKPRSPLRMHSLPAVGSDRATVCNGPMSATSRISRISPDKALESSKATSTSRMIAPKSRLVNSSCVTGSTPHDRLATTSSITIPTLNKEDGSTKVCTLQGSTIPSTHSRDLPRRPAIIPRALFHSKKPETATGDVCTLNIHTCPVTSLTVTLEKISKHAISAVTNTKALCTQSHILQWASSTPTRTLSYAAVSSVKLNLSNDVSLISKICVRKAIESSTDLPALEKCTTLQVESYCSTKSLVDLEDKKFIYSPAVVHAENSSCHTYRPHTNTARCGQKLIINSFAVKEQLPVESGDKCELPQPWLCADMIETCRASDPPSPTSPTPKLLIPEPLLPHSTNMNFRLQVINEAEEQCLEEVEIQKSSSFFCSSDPMNGAEIICQPNTHKAKVSSRPCSLFGNLFNKIGNKRTHSRPQDSSQDYIPGNKITSTTQREHSPMFQLYTENNR